MAFNQDAGTVTKKVIKSSPGTVDMILATNVGSSLRWLQLHNKATAPQAGDVPQVFLPLPAGTATQPTILEMYEENLTDPELSSFSTGIAWAISSTPGTFTDAATAAEHTVTMRTT